MQSRFAFQCSKAGAIADSSRLLFRSEQLPKKSELRVFDGSEDYTF
jgi:hypothetical protein